MGLFGGLFQNKIPGTGIDLGTVAEVAGAAYGGSAFLNSPTGFQFMEGTGIGQALQSPAVIAGGLTALGQEQANSAAQANSQAQMNFSAAQSASQYQRAVADMKAAGINPMLASQVGGNAAMGGSAAPVGSVLGAGVNSALDTYTRKAQVDSVNAQIDNLKAQNPGIVAQSSIAESESVKAAAQAKFWGALLKIIDDNKGNIEGIIDGLKRFLNPGGKPLVPDLQSGSDSSLGTTVYDLLNPTAGPASAKAASPSYKGKVVPREMSLGTLIYDLTH